eukprot:3136483-Prymnesium_polylepis.1
MTTSHSKVTHQSESNMPFEHYGEGLGVWHVWASGWTPGRACTSYARGMGTLGVWQRLAASGRLDVWTSGTS